MPPSLARERTPLSLADAAACFPLDPTTRWNMRPIRRRRAVSVSVSRARAQTMPRTRSIRRRRRRRPPQPAASAALRGRRIRCIVPWQSPTRTMRDRGRTQKVPWARRPREAAAGAARAGESRPARCGAARARPDRLRYRQRRQETAALLPRRPTPLPPVRLPRRARRGGGRRGESAGPHERRGRRRVRAAHTHRKASFIFGTKASFIIGILRRETGFERPQKSNTHTKASFIIGKSILRRKTGFERPPRRRERPGRGGRRRRAAARAPDSARAAQARSRAARSLAERS